MTLTTTWGLSSPSTLPLNPLRIGRLLSESVSYGPQFALIRFQMQSKEPLDPERTWRFWAERRGPVLDLVRKTLPLNSRRKRIVNRMLLADHASGIEDHYDVSNDLYKLFLDREYMFYSCAAFETDDESLEEAQRRKAERLVEFLDPHPGEKILDAACGWGPMLKAVYAATGDRENLEAHTLSRQQCRYVQGLGFNCALQNFITRDYQPESYDKIMIIAAVEHIRPAELRTLHQRLFSALKPGGRLVYQFSSLHVDPCPSSMIAAQIFFPGSMLSTHDAITRAIKYAGFRISNDDVSDYRLTLRAWFDNLVRNKESAIRLVGVETYNKYLLFFPCSWRAFNEGEMCLHRMLIQKP